MSTIQLKGREWRLPSLGKFYKDMPLINGESVILRPLLAGDQRYMVGGPDSYTSYTTLLNRVVVEPKNLDFSQFLLEDINSIIVGVRIMSYGLQYKMPFLCIECGQINRNQSVMLDTLEMTLSDEVDNFQVTDLPLEVDGHKLTYHLPTLKDEKQINTQLNVFKRSRRIKNEDMDRSWITLCQKIDSIDGKPVNFEEKFQFLENLRQEDFDVISEQLRKSTIGMSSTIGTTCGGCGASQDAGLVITPDFFRPNVN